MAREEYALIENELVVGTEFKADNFVADDVRDKFDYRPVENADDPVIDPDTEKIGPEEFAVEPARVVRTHSAVLLTQDELDARANQEELAVLRVEVAAIDLDQRITEDDQRRINRFVQLTAGVS